MQQVKHPSHRNRFPSILTCRAQITSLSQRLSSSITIEPVGSSTTSFAMTPYLRVSTLVHSQSVPNNPLSTTLETPLSRGKRVFDGGRAHVTSSPRRTLVSSPTARLQLWGARAIRSCSPPGMKSEPLMAVENQGLLAVTQPTQSCCWIILQVANGMTWVTISAIPFSMESPLMKPDMRMACFTLEQTWLQCTKTRDMGFHGITILWPSWHTTNRAEASHDKEFTHTNCPATCGTLVRSV